MAWFDFELKEGHHGQAHWAVAVVVATLCAFVATAVVGSLIHKPQKSCSVRGSFTDAFATTFLFDSTRHKS